MDRPSDLIQSVSRALRILELLGDEPDGLQAKVVARRTGLHVSTAYHLLRTLRYEGYVVLTGAGGYALASRAAREDSSVPDDATTRPCLAADGAPCALRSS